MCTYYILIYMTFGQYSSYNPAPWVNEGWSYRLHVRLLAQLKTQVSLLGVSATVCIYIYRVRSESGTKQETLWVGSYIAFGTCCMIPVYSYILRYASI